MTDTQNTRIVHRLFEDCFNRGDLALLATLVAPEHDGFKFIVPLREAFPDVTYAIDDTVAAGDKVALRWHWTGTHRGAFRGVAPTGASISTNGHGIFRLRDGKIIASTIETDRLGFLQQIGIVAPEGALFPASPPLR